MCSNGNLHNYSLLLITGCSICFNKLKDKPVTIVATCKHCKQAFCKGCLEEALKCKPCCPFCKVPLRKIMCNQPLGGTMIAQTDPNKKLPGYEKYGTIVINYEIPSGKQGKEHPNPGQSYCGQIFTAYLPESPDGKKVVQLLNKAFNAQLTFTLGIFPHIGEAVMWNDIHHKTNVDGGPTKLVSIESCMYCDCCYYIHSL